MDELESEAGAVEETETPKIEEVSGDAKTTEDVFGERETVDEEKPEKEVEKPIEDEIEEELDKEIEEELKNGRVDFSTLKKEYPDLFKKYPEMRDVIFRDQAYTKVLGSVEEAREAAQKAEIFDFMDQKLTQGDPTPLIKSLNDSALERFSTSILPALAERNPEMLMKATKPLIMNLIRNMDKENDGSVEGKNKAAAARILKRFLYGGDYSIPAKEDALEPDSVRQEREKLQGQQDRLWQEKADDFRTQRDDFTHRKLSELVSSQLDPTNAMAKGVRKALVDRVIADIGDRLANDEVHMSNMNALMRRAAKSGYSRQLIGQQVNAYLARARHLVGSAVQDYRQDKANNKIVKGKPVNTGSPSSGGAKLDPKRIDYRSSSTEDIFNDKVKFKK